MSGIRLGGTSYVIPGDLVANAEALRGVVADMELVLFDSPYGSNMPDREMVARLGEAATDMLTYSLHLPTHLQLAASDPAVRAHHVEAAAALIERCAPLPLSAIVVHLEGDEPLGGPPAAWEAWQGHGLASIQALREGTGVPLCVENIERYDIEVVLPVVRESGASLCFDVGHCWKVGRDPLPLMAALLGETEVIHLHGWDGTRDHRPLPVLAPGLLQRVFEQVRAAQWQGVLTLELFEDDFWLSRDEFQRVWSQLHAGT